MSASLHFENSRSSLSTLQFKNVAAAKRSICRIYWATNRGKNGQGGRQEAH